MPLLETKGAASAQGFGLTLGGAQPVYIEDVFSTWLYTGTGAAQTITNGIDLAGKGGMVWMKGRSGATAHALYDTTRGATFDLQSNSSAAQTTQSTGLTSFGATGFSIGALAKLNTSAETYASWSFRKQPKFFDIVTYTGTGANRTVAHNLGSVPGCIIIKSTTDSIYNWGVYHRSTTAMGFLPQQSILFLNTTGDGQAGNQLWNNTAPTSTVFSLGTDLNVNKSGETYVAYLFAHDAGGFGLTGTDNVITCGSYTGNGTSQKLTFGWEPQWIMFKVAAGTTNNWQVADIMRGLPNGATQRLLQPNLSGAENPGYTMSPVADGLTITGSAADINQSGVTYIYMAIRRGPMKKPTSGTQVFVPQTTGGSGAITQGFTTDMMITGNLASTSLSYKWFLGDRLRGVSAPGVSEISNALNTAAPNSEGFYGAPARWFDNTSYSPSSVFSPFSGQVNYSFRRAPGFFDVVCYSGSGTGTQTVAHNLGVTPELVIIKSRGASTDWPVAGGGSIAVLNSSSQRLGTAAAALGTATNLNLAAFNGVASLSTFDGSGSNYVAYLFASAPGICKIGTYSGSGGGLLQFDCGFTSGFRFLMIKRTNGTGSDWFVWDTARGVSISNEPYLRINSATAEVTGTNWVNQYGTAGFEITATASPINNGAGQYLYIAIA
jgi:hypothetical protein